jgi:flagellar biosynthesis/type III secretory pathway ATPase
MIDIVMAGHRALAQSVRALIAAHREVEPLLALGAYKAGGVPMADQAIARWDQILDFLAQAVTDRTTFEDTLARLATLVEAAALRSA